MDDQLNAPTYKLLLEVLEKSQSGQTTTFTVEASSTECLYDKKYIDTGSDVAEKALQDSPLRNINQSRKEQLNAKREYPIKVVMVRRRFILEETVDDNGYDKNAYEGCSVERDCHDIKKPYICTIYTSILMEIAPRWIKSSITGYTVLHNCPKRFPVMTCTLTITGKSMETGSVECEEIHLSKAHFTRITPPYDYLMREIKNKAESILFEMDSEKESGVYKKLTSIDAALQFGSVKKIQLTAADTDCKVAGENAYTGVLVADDCHELLALHQYTIVYVDSPYAALLSCAQAAKMIII
ncbi:hypothetical protein T10_33 [Trichinella papuae]|uniref:Uncharacterized protein n=1 Tax=Trichinella papuae TaxID=268474 RepID=A0A0V1MI53_9BILA|nr:hypothetical protein T10_33 [Trichinella papuae]